VSRGRGRKTGKEAQRQFWLRDYEGLIENREDYTGQRIDWDLATHLQNQGKTPQEAARDAVSPYLAPTQHGW
jgi:hypothetical protein